MTARYSSLSSLLIATSLLAGLACAQPQPVFETVACVKVAPGKSAEYRQFVSEATKAIMQARVNAGEIESWTLYRSIMPAGAEARCDYRSVTTSAGLPAEPQLEALGKTIAKAGIKMTAPQYLARRDALSHLAAYEMWQPWIRVGEPKKGNYVFLNHMKVLDEDKYYHLEGDIWRPMAEEWVRQGAQSGWQFSTALFPGGSEVKYAAMSMDFYPTWEAAFKVRTVEETFKKVHPGKDYQTTMTDTSSRDLAVRELMVIEERIKKN